MDLQIFENLLQAAKYEIVSEKGQRTFRPIDPAFSTDSCYDEVKKHEIFVSNLPNDMFENELLPFLCRAGPVYQVRLIINFSGLTKGMAYVVFSKVQHAYNAIEKLDGEYVRKDCPLRTRLSFSVNNTRLLIKKIPQTTSDEMKKELEKNLIGITSVKIFENQQGLNALVTFDSHRLAANARRLLVPTGIDFKIFGVKVDCDWAKPRDHQSVYVRFNCSFFNKDKVRDFFENNFVSKSFFKVKYVTIQGQVAFVKFYTFSDANFVVKRFREMDIKFIPINNYLQITDISWPLRK